MFQYLKQELNAIWQAESNLVIIVELKRKVEYSWECPF